MKKEGVLRLSCTSVGGVARFGLTLGVSRRRRTVEGVVVVA